MEDSVSVTLRVWAGELALEEHSGTGPAVDAEVCEARLVHQLLPHAVRAGRLEETLHPGRPGAETPHVTGQETRYDRIYRPLVNMKSSGYLFHSAEALLTDLTSNTINIFS